jgi:hypothetical protein
VSRPRLVDTIRPGDPVRVYSIGYGRTFPGVVTETTDGGAFVRTDDGGGERVTFYPSRYVIPEDSRE